MSTRCNIRFLDGNNRVVANIYRHSDGYPDTEHGVLHDLKQFFSDVEAQTKDRRFLDPSYLAAKFVVWQALKNGNDPTRPLDFISLGIVSENAGDGEFVYDVDCEVPDADGRPIVSWRSV